MLLPQSVSILIWLHSDPCLTQWTNDYVQRVNVPANGTLVIVRSSMIATKDLTAVLTFKRHEISLIARLYAAVLADLRFQHFWLLTKN